jgi:hypothetical protein
MFNALLELGIVLYGEEIYTAGTMITNGFSAEEVRTEINMMRAEKKRRKRAEALKKLRR